MVMIPCGGFGIGNGLSVEKDEFGRPILNVAGGGGGSSDVLVVNLIYDESTETLSVDKTFNEIFEQASNSKPVVMFDGGHFLSLDDLSEERIVFYLLLYGGSNDEWLAFDINRLAIYSDDTLEDLSSNIKVTVYNEQ